MADCTRRKSSSADPEAASLSSSQGLLSTSRMREIYRMNERIHVLILLTAEAGLLFGLERTSGVLSSEKVLVMVSAVISIMNSLAFIVGRDRLVQVFNPIAAAAMDSACFGFHVYTFAVFGEGLLDLPVCLLEDDPCTWWTSDMNSVLWYRLMLLAMLWVCWQCVLYSACLWHHGLALVEWNRARKSESWPAPPEAHEYPTGPGSESDQNQNQNQPLRAQSGSAGYGAVVVAERPPRSGSGSD